MRSLWETNMTLGYEMVEGLTTTVAASCRGYAGGWRGRRGNKILRHVVLLAADVGWR